MGIEVLRVLAFGSVKDDGDDPATDGGKRTEQKALIV